MESGGGDGSETGSVTEEKIKKIEDQYRCQPHAGLQGEKLDDFTIKKLCTFECLTSLFLHLNSVY